MSRVIQLTRELSPKEDALVNMITDVPRVGGLKNYDKEITEAMAMVDAVERAIRLIIHVPLHRVVQSNVFVIGDGKYPIAASVLCLFLQQHRHDGGGSGGGIQSSLGTNQLQTQT